jgi:phospholipase/lecithinase/hemolysin
VINMVDVLAEHPTANFYMDPVHPTATGHQVIAGELYSLIRALPEYAQACVPPANVVSTQRTPTNAQAR